MHLLHLLWFLKNVIEVGIPPDGKDGNNKQNYQEDYAEDSNRNRPHRSCGLFSYSTIITRNKNTEIMAHDPKLLDLPSSSSLAGRLSEGHLWGHNPYSLDLNRRLFWVKQYGHNSEDQRSPYKRGRGEFRFSISTILGCLSVIQSSVKRWDTSFCMESHS